MKKLEEVKKFNKLNDNKFYGLSREKNSPKFRKPPKFNKESQLPLKVKKQEINNIGMNAASMLVGQYYMSEINEKLKYITNEVSKISEFQKSEYNGNLTRIFFKIKEILDNQNEILGNNETIKNAYNDIKETERTCSKLLGHANDIIRNKINKEELDYKKYKERVKEIEIWIARQEIT